MKEPTFHFVAAWLLLILLGGLVLGVCVDSLWPLGVAQIGIFGLALAALVRIARGRADFVRDWVLLPLLLMPAWGCFQVLARITVSPFDTWSRVLLYGTYACAYFVGCQTLRTPRAHHLFQTGCVIFGFLLALEAMLQWFTAGTKIFWLIETDVAWFVFGPFVNHDHFSVMMELLLPLPLWLAITRRRQSMRFLIMAATMFASIVMAASRAGFPIAMAELIIFLAIAIKHHGKSIGVFATVTLFLIFSAIVGWDVLFERYKQPYEERVFFYQGGLDMVRQKPVTGFGLGSWWTAYPRYAVYDANALLTHAHNDWLEWTAEGGFPFLAIMLTFAAAGLRNIWQFPPLLGVAAVFLHSFADFGLQEPAIFLFLIAILASAKARSISAAQAAALPTERPRSTPAFRDRIGAARLVGRAEWSGVTP